MQTPSNQAFIIDNTQFSELMNMVKSMYQKFQDSEPATSKKIDVLLTTAEAASRLKVCSKTVTSYIKNGQLKAVKFTSGKRGHFKILSSEVDRYIKEKRLGY